MVNVVDDPDRLRHRRSKQQRHIVVQRIIDFNELSHPKRHQQMPAVPLGAARETRRDSSNDY